MAANDYMYAIDRNDEYLAHYGIKGMKWGVRKAIESGNSRALARQYRKASRKLAKLQRQASNGKKYARRAAALGAGAAAAGGLAAAGTHGVGQAVKYVGRAGHTVTAGLGTAGKALGNAMVGTRNPRLVNAGVKVWGAGNQLEKTSGHIRAVGNRAGNAVQRWGKGTQGGEALQRAATKGYGAAVSTGVGRNVAATTNRALAANGKKTIQGQINKLGGVSNNTLARIGAAGIGAGLAAGAGYNAYRAATTKRAAKKAAEFQREMNQAFKGTQYANGGGSSSNRNRKRRRK